MTVEKTMQRLELEYHHDDHDRLILIEDDSIVYNSTMIIYRKDLNESSSRYDYLVAMPEQYERMRLWMAWVVIAGTVSLMCLTLILSILSSRKTRIKPFNLYIVFLTFPDFLFSFLCAITCLISRIEHHHPGDEIIHDNDYYIYTDEFIQQQHHDINTMGYNSAGCQAQSFYCVFGWTANMWMNSLIAYRIKDLLETSHRVKRYKLPSTKQVILNSLCVYIFSLFVAGITVLGKYFSIIPLQTRLVGGSACLPSEYNSKSTLFFWLCFIPLMMGIPFAYVLYVVYICYKKSLLPKGGKRRYLALYFLRLIVAFVLMWLPAIVLIYGSNLKVWIVSVVGGSLSHLQGSVSVIMCLQKPDIKKSFKDFITCRCTKENCGKNRNGTRRRTSSNESNRKRRSSQESSRTGSIRRFSGLVW